jgi:UDP-GlcNAc3NAcA epimerase
LKVIAILGARPQFIKHFAFEKACEGKLDLITIHTGQHYDKNMSAFFFDQLGMNKPDYLLSIGSGSHGVQTGQMMIEIEAIVLKEKPDGIVVYGDTNSTLAGALVGAKLNISIVHIEAGLRGFNKEMPEEINRILTDQISDLLLVPSKEAVENLQKEGISNGVHIVGDIMKDLIVYCKENNLILKNNEPGPYYYATIHRPYNTDDQHRLGYVLDNLNQTGKKVIFAIHPRTTNVMTKYNIERKNYPNIYFIEPQAYFENLSFLFHSEGLITDSGGMQKEAYWLQKKCVTIRKETEWVETLEANANHLLFEDLSSLKEMLQTDNVEFEPGLYGDGMAADKIVNLILTNSDN